MTQEEVTIWEIKNQHKIIKWEIDYVSDSELKIITFFLSDKSTVIFKVKK
jgi:hypothetical protein